MSAWISSGARPRPKTGQGKSTLRYKMISSELRAKLSNRNITIESSTPCAVSTRSCTDRGFQLEFQSCQDTRLLLRIPWIVIYLRRPRVGLCDFPRAGGVLLYAAPLELISLTALLPAAREVVQGPPASLPTVRTNGDH